MPVVSGMCAAALAEAEHPGWGFIRKPLDSGRLREMIVGRLAGQV